MKTCLLSFRIQKDMQTCLRLNCRTTIGMHLTKVLQIYLNTVVTIPAANLHHQNIGSVRTSVLSVLLHRKKILATSAPARFWTPAIAVLAMSSKKFKPWPRKVPTQSCSQWTNICSNSTRTFANSTRCMARTPFRRKKGVERGSLQL